MKYINIRVIVFLSKYTIIITKGVLSVLLNLILLLFGQKSNKVLFFDYCNHQFSNFKYRRLKKNLIIILLEKKIKLWFRKTKLLNKILTF